LKCKTVTGCFQKRHGHFERSSADKEKRLSISKTLMIDHLKPSESEFNIAELAERLAVSQN
jgi:hypothetical protein